MGSGIDQYAKPPERETVRIDDARDMDGVTGTKVSDTKRLHADADMQVVKDIIASSVKHGIDPYTALAIGLQESGLSKNNPMHVHPDNEYEGSSLEYGVKFLKEKIELAKRLGKKTEAEIIQAWNGYGKLGALRDDPNIEDDAAVGKWYGLDVSKSAIDMSKNPVYGRRVMDIRDNILKKNPQIAEMIKASSKPQYEWSNNESVISQYTKLENPR